MNTKFNVPPILLNRKTLSIDGYRLFYLYIYKLGFSSNVLSLNRTNAQMVINVNDWLAFMIEDQQPYQSLQRAIDNIGQAEIYINDQPHTLFSVANYINGKGAVVLKLSDYIYNLL